MDPLITLPDDLNRIIFSYLSYHEKMTVISCNTSLYQLYFKKERVIQLFGEHTIDFFHDLNFQQMILEKIASPLDQLFLSDSGCNIFNPSFDGNRIVPRLNGVKTLVLSIDIYVKLNESYPDSIPLVQNLQLFSSFHEEIAVERILPFLPRVTKSIHFYSLQLPKELSLSSSIEELSFENCNVINHLSSSLPNLRAVKLVNSFICNLNDFNHLEELTIDESQIFAMTNYSAWITAKKLHIEWS